MSEFTFGFNIFKDLVLNNHFWDMYRFKGSEPKRIFNTAYVLYCIRKFLKQKEELNSSLNSSTIRDNLHNFPRDSQTLPLQILLNLVINNPLATNYTPLLSFMFYIGAITYKPDLSANIIFEYPIKLLQVLEANNNIEPLCRFIEKTLLKPLKDNNIVYSNEKALKQAFMDAMILTLHSDIEPEFLVYSQSPDLDGKAINLIKINNRKRIAIEFDNIRMNKVLLDRARGCWQEAIKVSRSLLEKTKNEVLKLKIDD
ncbi:3988_t:CDS:2 [Dentiscutata erythropus]|uniref:3988_t:CDS:1 n=1 Tax=Dentiscutata erythropus TaxID=1348616 RepID=A0A9N8VIH9_9GLOM|nr:3988_t:CDS:2 [Dentiscutata erythropus]